MNWLRRLGDRYLTTSLRHRSFAPNEQIKSKQVAVLFSANSLPDQQEALHFCALFKDLIGLQPCPLGFLNRKLDASVSFSFPHYSLSDLNLLSKPFNSKIDLFLQRPYYAVINLDRHNVISLHYLNHLLAANHKLAIHPVLPRLYDIVIDPEQELTSVQIHGQILDIFKKIRLEQ